MEGDIDVAIFKAIIDQGNGKHKTKEQLKNDFEDACKAQSFPAGLEMTNFEADGTPIYKFKRDPVTGKFDDAQLVAEMVQVIEDPICESQADQSAHRGTSLTVQVNLVLRMSQKYSGLLKF